MNIIGNGACRFYVYTTYIERVPIVRSKYGGQYLQDYRIADEYSRNRSKVLVQSTQRCRHPTTSVIAPLRASFKTKWLCSYASCDHVTVSTSQSYRFLGSKQVFSGACRSRFATQNAKTKKNRLFFFVSGHSPLLQPAAYFLPFLPAAAGLGVTTLAEAGVERALAGAAGAPGAGVPLCIQLMICCVAIGMMNNNALFPRRRCTQAERWKR